MKQTLALAVLLTSLAALHAAEPKAYHDKSPKRYELTARASQIDSRTRPHPEIEFVFEKDGKPQDVQHAMVDTRVPPRGKLVIWLMGHNGPLFERLSGYGLHSIQVHYANGWFGKLNKEPPPGGDDKYLGKIRLEAATGEDFSDAINIPKPDGMTERSFQLVKWLAKESPQGRWEQFLTADRTGLRWDEVIMAGISHGSTTAARFAIHQKVDRVVMFSGPRDQLENWYSLPSATPSNRFFGFTHVLDGGWTGDHYCRSWQLLGLNQYGPVVNVEKSLGPFGNSRRLITDADVQKDAQRAHSSSVPGGAAVKDASGKFIHEAVWKYLFTHPVEQTGQPVPADPDCKLNVGSQNAGAGRGESIPAQAGCAACQLFRSEGGVTGPDLTLAANKFAARELLMHITEPSKVVSDQYAATLIELEDGTVVTGRVVNNDALKMQIQPNLYLPSDAREFACSDIAEVRRAEVSLMPASLLNTCHPDEVADLMAGIQSGLKAAIAAPPSIPIAGVPAPIAHWQFEDQDLEVRDSAGAHHGTVHGATSQAGKFGKGLLFDRAKEQHVAIAYSPDFAIGTFTVSAWVWLTKEPTFSGILGTRASGEFNFDMKVNTDKVHGDIGDGTRWIDTSINFYKTDVGSNGQGGDLEIRRWYLITFVIDNDQQECRLYLDADRKRTIPFKGEPRLMRPGQTMTIGNTGSREFMDGVIDDVRIWKHALTDQQIRSLIVP